MRHFSCFTCPAATRSNSCGRCETYYVYTPWLQQTVLHIETDRDSSAVEMKRPLEELAGPEPVAGEQQQQQEQTWTTLELCMMSSRVEQTTGQLLRDLEKVTGENICEKADRERAATAVEEAQRLKAELRALHSLAQDNLACKLADMRPFPFREMHHLVDKLTALTNKTRQLQRECGIAHGLL